MPPVGTEVFSCRPAIFIIPGSARQEYRTLRGLNFVWGQMRFPVPGWPGQSVSVPIGLSLYLKEEQADKLQLPYQTRSALAREIVDFVAAHLPTRRIRVLGDGGYATKDTLHQLPATVDVVSRMLITGKLYAPPPPRSPRAEAVPRRKGYYLVAKNLGVQAVRLAAPSHRSGGARSSMDRAVAYRVAGTTPSGGRGAPSAAVPSRKPGQRKPLPRVEAFFTTDLTLSLDAILAQYRERWAVEITIRDGNAFAGFGQDQCRKQERVVGVNTLRLLLAAARTLWFVEHTARTPALT